MDLLLLPLPRDVMRAPCLTGVGAEYSSGTSQLDARGAAPDQRGRTNTTEWGSTAQVATGPLPSRRNRPCIGDGLDAANQLHRLAIRLRPVHGLHCVTGLSDTLPC